MLTLILHTLFLQVDSIHKELYTTNAICRRKYCVNPVFPGMEDLHRLEKAKWVATTLTKTAPSLGFCRGAINYNPALPAPPSGSASIHALVRTQEQAAITMFAYHLSGMGLEYWDHTDPLTEEDDCIKSIWRMVCYTYFPKALVGSKEGQESRYLRPCQSSCFNYIRTCNVECCDESVQCVFEHTKQFSFTEKRVTTGYVAHDGPSQYCTGSARRGQNMSFWILIVCILFSMFNIGDAVAIDVASFSVPASRSLAVLKTLSVGLILSLAFVLQGCSDVISVLGDGSDVPTHGVGNWRGERDYIMAYEFIPPGGTARSAKLNSCSFKHLAQSLQCSGNGICQQWDKSSIENPIAFCQCDRDWADPECRTPRKSQIKSYLFSVFLGFLGADMFYLGFPLAGMIKLFTLGGCGAWWLYDIVRLGCYPAYAYNFRVAADLPHWAFVLVTVSLAITLGFVIIGALVARHRYRRRKDALLMQAEDEARKRGEELPTYYKPEHRLLKNNSKSQTFIPYSVPQKGPSGPYMQRL